MKNALILYNSRTGITKKFAEEISIFLTRNHIVSKVKSIDDYHSDDLSDCDHILLGCWTDGLMVFLQHPDKKWVEFAKKLPQISGKKIILFTTYKLATGSMFKKMKSHINCNPQDFILELKSKNGSLTEAHQKEIQTAFDFYSGEKVPA